MRPGRVRCGPMATLTSVLILEELDHVTFQRSRFSQSRRARKDSRIPGLRDAALLVRANKQDRSKALSVAKLKEQLELQKLCARTWCVQPATAPLPLAG